MLVMILGDDILKEFDIAIKFKSKLICEICLKLIDFTPKEATIIDVHCIGTDIN